MNLSAVFIRRPVMTVLVMAAILVFGLVAYRSMPVSDLPNVDMPTIEVSVGYPGANPETMANSIATPLEQQFMTIEGVQTIASSSNTGSTSLVIQFNLDRDIDVASTDVQAAISRAQPKLPSNLPSNPTYRKVNPSATPIMYLAVVSENMPLSDLYDYGNTFIGNRLSMIEGVSQVVTYGSPYAVRIQVDPEKLAARDIGLDEVVQTIANNNVNIPVGTLYGKRDEFTIDVDGQMMRAPGYAEIIIKNESGDLVKIKDIGHALDSVQNDKFFLHYLTKQGDNQCVALGIQRLPGSNTVEIVQRIRKALDELIPQLPDTVKISIIYDQSESIIESINEVKLTLIVAFLLVVTIIFFSLGKVLNTVIPSLSLPMSIFGTFAVIYLLGYSIDILSLLAITLSIGFLVDDAIVVLENNVRHVQMGKSPFEASLVGSKEISITILSMTLCLISAFLPMLFMSGVIGKLFHEFAVTIIVAVLISGFVSLSLTPMLSSRFVKPYSQERKPRMEQIADKINEKMKTIYEPCLHWAMDHRLIMIGVGLFCVVTSLLLFKALPKDFLPADDIGFIQGFTLSRDGTSPFLMDDYHHQINEIAIQDPNVEAVISISSFSNDNQGITFFRLKPFKERLPLNEVIKGLNVKYQEVPGINVYLSPLPLINLSVGTTVMALYQYSLTSIDHKTLYEYAPTLATKLKTNPAFTSVSSDLRNKQPQWNIHILRDKMANYNVNAASIESYFSYAYSNNKISQINADINQYDVIVETLPRFYRDPSVFSKLYVRSSLNALVPLSELVEAEEIIGPLTINHINGLPAVNISFNPADNIPLGTTLDTINELSKDMPSQIHGQVIGTANVLKSSFESLTFLMLLAFFIIYIVLGILYESFIHPITVMSALPPTLFGGLFTLFIFKQTLSLYSFVGLILLIGIVLKNGIMMVDFANELRLKGKSAYEAIIEAALVRFRPIIMTTLCALMGAVPIALGIGGAMGQTRVSLGLCIVGGLLISQLLTLLLTPVLFFYFETLQEKLDAALLKRRASKEDK